MFDLNSKFNTFYRDHVVLSRDEQNQLNEKKRLNIARLESGLSDYNREKNASYNIVDTIVQGSMAMHSITQRDNHQYDIDIAIIFDKANIPGDTNRVKRIVAEALKEKMGTFNTKPKVKTNAITIEYAEGYHVDFAIYRRFADNNGDYKYEHCGASWNPRDPRAITNWFNNQNENNGNLRKVLRLLKMFCKSRNDWSMPGGLVLSVLSSECLSSDPRLDITFYNTICAIRDRLNSSQEVYNPIASKVSLLFDSKDKREITNLSTELTKSIVELDILFAGNCTQTQAMHAWNEFFKHDYWSNLAENAESSLVHMKDEKSESGSLMLSLFVLGAAVIGGTIWLIFKSNREK